MELGSCGTTYTRSFSLRGARGGARARGPKVAPRRVQPRWHDGHVEAHAARARAASARRDAAMLQCTAAGT
eukprot:3011231-Prymnesium_polylepis.1